MTKIIAKILKEIAKAYKPLVDAAMEDNSGQAFIRFINTNLGCDISIHSDNSSILMNLLFDLIQVYDVFIELSNDPSQLLKLIENLDSFVHLVETLGNLTTSNIDSNQEEEIIKDLGPELLNYLILSYLRSNSTKVYYILILLGVIHKRKQDLTPINEDSILMLDWDNLSKLISAPDEVFGSVYGWDTKDFNPNSLFWNILCLFEAFGIYGDIENEGTREVTLEIPLFIAESFEIGGKLLSIIDDNNSKVDGIALVPYGVAKVLVPIDLCIGWVLQFGASASVDVNFGIHARPSGVIDVGPVDGGSWTKPDITLSLEAYKKTKEGASEVILFGKPNESRLEAVSVGIKVGLHVGSQTPNEYFVQGNLKQGMMVIKGGEGDGFLKKILPPKGVTVPLDLTMGWSNLTGFFFKGSAGLEVTIPVYKTFGPLRIDSIYIKGGISETGNIELQTSLSFGANIGPVVASVNRVGIKTNIQLGNSPKFIFGFNPPTGVGLAIDANGLVGGGFLEFDFKNARYTGILQLTYGELGLTAIGIIETKMPDGTTGFSMLLSINVTFNPAFTLPYNFKLHAVGGLVGIHRRMVSDRIRKGLKSGILRSIMFPEDPIANANSIISNMRSVFPPKNGRFIIAPQVKISWSELIFADLGVFIEIPHPVQIIILGRIYTALPSTERPLICINLDTIGIIDFNRKTISVDASLYNSNIVGFNLTGNAAMRLSWGANPNFALAIGGFHPSYNPPRNFPRLKRISLSLGSGKNPRINLATYLAITSNTAQFGASLDLYATAGPFSIKAYLGFDTLFRFNPFYFSANLGANVGAYFNKDRILTLYLNCSLTGPSPWHAKGSVSFTFLFFDVKISFDETWGRSENVFLAAVDPWPEFLTALENPSSWRGISPVGKGIVATIREEEAKNSIIVHPMGALEVHQRVVPLNIVIEKYGNAPITTTNRYRITKGAKANFNLTYTKEHFAPAQFKQMSDSQKLSSPAFEKLSGGVILNWKKFGIDIDSQVDFILEYETSILDEKIIEKPRFKGELLWDYLGAYTISGSASELSQTNHKRKLKIELIEEGYAIVSTSDLRLMDIPSNDGSLTYIEVHQVLDEYLILNPEMVGKVRVVPNFEVVK